MNWFHKEAKNKGYPKKSVFEKHGFLKLKNPNKKIYVRIDTCEYQFDYETNKIYEIPDKDIKFAVCVRDGKQILFSNQDYIYSKDTTSPYRTFYEGLMKEPFRFCYPFHEEVLIEVKSGRITWWCAD